MAGPTSLKSKDYKYIEYWKSYGEAERNNDDSALYKASHYGKVMLCRIYNDDLPDCQY